MWKNWNLHTVFVGMYNRAANVENSLTDPQKAKHKITI